MPALSTGPDLSARGGDGVGRLSQPVLSGLGVVVLGGAVHRFGLDPRHDGVAFELADFFPEVAVSALSVVIRIKRDIPEDDFIKI